VISTRFQYQLPPDLKCVLGNIQYYDRPDIFRPSIIKEIKAVIAGKPHPGLQRTPIPATIETNNEIIGELAVRHLTWLIEKKKIDVHTRVLVQPKLIDNV